MASTSRLAFTRLLSSTFVVPRPAAAYRLFSTKSGFYDLITPAMSLSHVIQSLEDEEEGPLVVATGGRLGWDVKDKENALHVRIDMPGLSREDVKLSLEQDTLVIKGEEHEEGRKFSSRIELPQEEYKANEIKAEMKNGVLKVVVPKIIQLHLNNPLHIKVD
ncbi:23.5 kDa heat shock protein, mitochondrial-like [Brassica rapa]|uniref:SHSP domain-containing protein n=1 Tax=Brassica campestris TaxID=3711 RepID=A0A3P6CUN4_BRACM|nr:23.5 kDa heat shock protein, mitochondrial-like [Brassica rapa]CAG7909693.1 unnamed protein product [Brassica rapa]VDD17298.1 unnamed protein product [Brassica rapa]